MSSARIGTAGWSVPAGNAANVPVTGSHLARYAARFDAVEINSSFYRPHRPATYARWADSVPEGFLFAVKVPKTITHERRLVEAAEPLDRFLDETSALGAKRGPLLVQLPPSLRFDPETAAGFLTLVRERYAGDVACEPRHATWFTPDAETLLAGHRVARVSADPPPVPSGREPAGWPGLAYYRFHGAPKVYHSDYGPADRDAIGARLAAHLARGTPVWCIFDNTALGHAFRNALALRTSG